MRVLSSDWEREKLALLRTNGNAPIPAITLFKGRSSAAQGWINSDLKRAKTGLRLVQFGELANSHHMRPLALARISEGIRES